MPALEKFSTEPRAIFFARTAPAIYKIEHGNSVTASNDARCRRTCRTAHQLRFSPTFSAWPYRKANITRLASKKKPHCCLVRF